MGCAKIQWQLDAPGAWGCVLEVVKDQVCECLCECRWLVEQGRALGVEVIDRCNLTVLQEPGQEDLVDFLASHQVKSIATPRT